MNSTSDNLSYSPLANDNSAGNISVAMERDGQCTVCSQVLMDPMTLCCGHSFCQFCLATIWNKKSRPLPATLQCPTCYQSWSKMPKINIQLRNIIENVHGESLSERRFALTSQDEELIKSFSSIKPLTNENAIMGFMALVLCLALGVFFAMVCIFAAWMRVGPSGLFSRKPVSMWKSEDVLLWVEGLGEWTSPNITGLFQNQALTGPQLMLVDNQTLAEFGIEQEFRIQTILEAIEQLRVEVNNQPQDFYEFKAAHRKTALLLVVSYPSVPRLTLLYSYLFEYYTVYLPLGRSQFTYAQPEEELSWLQGIVLFAMVLLFPHMEVSMLCYKWLFIHPWICTPVLLYCCIQTILTLLQVPAMIKRPLSYIKTNLLTSGGPIFYSVLFVAIYHIVWPIIPYFICDIVFYVLLWWPLFSVLLGLGIVYFIRRGVFNNIIRQ